MMSRQRVLLDASQYRVSQAASSGLGVRAAELAETLSRTCSVTVFSPGVEDPLYLGDAVLAPPESDWRDLVAATDAVMFFDVADPARLDDAVAAGVLIVSETAPPIEHATYPSLLRSADPQAAHRAMVDAYVRQVSESGHFVCRSAAELTTILGSLVTLGRIGPSDLSRSRTLDDLVTTVPIGYSRYSRLRMRSAAQRQTADVVWTGGLWAGYRPNILVDAIALLANSKRDVTAAYLYGQSHPDSLDLLASLDNRIIEQDVRTKVTVHRDPIPHYSRDEYLKGAAAFVCVAEPGAENSTCVRLRIRDSKLFGVPLITDGHGGTADEVRRDGTGVVLANGDPAELARTIDECVRKRSTTAPPIPHTTRFEYPTDLFGLVPRLHRFLN